MLPHTTEFVVQSWNRYRGQYYMRSTTLSTPKFNNHFHELDFFDQIYSLRYN